ALFLELSAPFSLDLTGAGAISSASEPVRSVGSGKSLGSVAGATGPGSAGAGPGPWSCPRATKAVDDAINPMLKTIKSRPPMASTPCLRTAPVDASVRQQDRT